MAAAADGAVDRAVLEQFLRTSLEAVRSQACRDILRDPASGRPGAKLVDMQKEVWDSLGVPTDVGRRAVSRIDQNFPEDHAELVALRSDFATAIDAAYLQSLADRRPRVLERKAKMRRPTVLEFLDACNVKMDLPEVRERLRKRIEETGAMPEDVVNDIHGEVMELLGFEREHGQRCFSSFGASKEFERDREVAVSFGRWRGKTSSVCLSLLSEFQKEGGQVNVGDEVRATLVDMRAKEGLDTMSLEDRSRLLEKNAKKVNVFRNLPAAARERYLEKLSEEDRLELTQAEILMVTIAQSQQQRSAQEAAKWSE